MVLAPAPLRRLGAAVLVGLVLAGCTAVATVDPRPPFELASAAEQSEDATALVYASVEAIAGGMQLAWPDAQANLSPEASQRLAGFESWYAVFGESLQDGLVRAPEFLQPTWGTVLQRQVRGGGVEYWLHIREWPRAPQLILPSHLRDVEHVELWGFEDGPYELGWQHIDRGTQFYLPRLRPHPSANVVRVLCASAAVAPEVVHADRADAVDAD